MKSIVEIVIRMFKEHPLRAFLSLFSLFAGSFLLASSWGISDSIERISNIASNEKGIVLTLANGEVSKDGSFSRKFPSEFDKSIVSKLKEAVPQTLAVSPITNTPFGRFQVGKQLFQVRRVLGVNQDYIDVMGLSIVAGANFTEGDIDQKKQVALLSKDSAISLFGSETGAVGKSFEVVFGGRGQRLGGNGGSNNQNAPQASSARNVEIPRQTFVVLGVYEIPSETYRSQNGIGDALIGYSAAVPGGVDVPEGFFWGTIAFRARVNNVSEAQTALGELLLKSSNTPKFVIWKGNPLQPNLKAGSTSEALSALVSLINIMGLVLVLISGVGMYGIMTVEVSGRTRQFGIRRALGFNKGQILGLILIQALVLSFIGSIIGIGLSMVLSSGIVLGLSPWFERVGLDLGVLGSLGFNPIPYIAALSAMLASSALFGLAPALKILRTSPVNLLREDGL